MPITVVNDTNPTPGNPQATIWAAVTNVGGAVGADGSEYFDILRSTTRAWVRNERETVFVWKGDPSDKTVLVRIGLPNEAVVIR